jgi:hypothetical protein
MDRDLTCRSCGVSFPFTSGEQAFYLRKGFDNEPSRCPECRANGLDHVAASSGNQPDSPQVHQEVQLFSAHCTQCGTATMVTAQVALGDDSIYCGECAGALGGSGPKAANGWQEDW